MRNIALLFGLLILVGSGSGVLAQFDSTRLNAGYISLKRDLTQTIIIKGSDLEKMPFSDLSDAIAAWTYGAYAQPAGLVYIVDGNTVSDVNAYSVFDIEEVILVQNAAVLATTAAGQQELVLIRTRRGRGKSGVTAAGQSGLVNVSGYHPTARWYQNFYVGAYRNRDKVSVGLSANYQRDVFPDTISGHTAVNPEGLERWRLNGYIDWRFDKRNLVELTMNYTSQQQPEAWDSIVQPLDNRVSNTACQHFVLPHLYWHSDLASGLKNELQATYFHGSYTSRAFQSGSTYLNLFGDAFDSTYDHPTSYHLLLWDRLEYRGKIGHVDVEPALNVSYEYGRDKDSLSGFSGDEPTSAGVGTRQVYTTYYFTPTLISTPVVLTPAVDLTYKRAFDLQAGVLIDAGHQHGPGNRQGFPFVSLMVDPLQMGRKDVESSLRLFGSYAQRTVTTLPGYTLSGLGAGAPSLGAGAYYDYPINGINNPNPGNYLFGGPEKPPVYWAYDAGAAYTTWKDRLLIQYTFERRNYSTGIVFPGVTYNDLIFPEVKSALNRIEFRLKILEAAGLRWETGINMTMLRNNVESNAAQYYRVVAIGDVAPSAWSETGGWVNRIQVKGFMAGLDLLYHFGETEIVPQPFDNYIMRGGKRNSMLVPNIYAGYGRGGLEFFVESRGAIRNSPNDLSDGRRFYTLGGKLTI
jgi:hypothetical protein